MAGTRVARNQAGGWLVALAANVFIIANRPVIARRFSRLGAELS
jgi:hypothetical protein